MTLLQLATSAEAGAFYALVVAGMEKKFQFIKPGVRWFQAHKGIVKAALQEGVVLADEAIQSPALAGLKLELEHAKHELVQSQIFKASTAVLHNLTTKVEDLTPDQKNVVALAIVQQAHSLFGVTVTAHQVLGVLDELQQLAKEVGPEASVQGAEQLTKPVPVPAQPATA